MPRSFWSERLVRKPTKRALDSGSFSKGFAMFKGLTTSQGYHVCGLAEVDPKTLRRFLAGTHRTQPAIAKAIEAALRTIGRADVIPSASEVSSGAP
jgi:hypothetical protein